ncbi:MAG: gamma carbonic anhydrase family protein [Actinobacteria bacterium]|nr:gamma carbonic anhydrase family protein [Actinomycetota bacterium]
MAIYALGDHTPDIHPDAYIHPDAVIIGSVTIGAESSVWPSAVLRGDDGEIIVGARTSIQDGAVLHTTAFTPTTVGDDCVIGHLAHLEGCTIQDRALVGSQSVVLHNAIVESLGLVGAGALVPNNMIVPAKSMALGVPAKLRVDAVDPALIEFSARSYVERSRRFRSELRRVD